MKYIRISEAARVLRLADVTLRQRAAAGLIPGAKKVHEREWMIPRRYAYGYGRAPEEEQAESRAISTDGALTVVLAINEDGRYGAYIEEDWVSADAALEIEAYFREHHDWLKRGRDVNRKEQLKALNRMDIPQDQRPAENAWECIQQMVSRGEATLDYVDEVYLVKFHTPDSNEVTPLRDLEYSSDLGLYDKRQFPTV